METIKDIRDKIALCDDEIIYILNKRMQLIQEIIIYNKKMGLPIFQPEQEQKQVTILKEKLTGHLLWEYLVLLDGDRCLKDALGKTSVTGSLF